MADEPEIVQETKAEAAVCTVIVLKRFIIAETIIAGIVIMTLLLLWKIQDPVTLVAVFGSFMTLATAVTMYYFNLQSNEQKRV